MFTLRAQKLKNGSYSLYLDIYEQGKRQREYLNIHVSRDYTRPMEDKAGNIVFDGQGKPKEKRVEAKDKEKWELAQSIRMKRELEIKTTDHGFVASFKKSADFIAYFDKVRLKKNHCSYDSTLKYLKDFAGSEKSYVSFKSVNEEWIAKFKAYLLSKTEPSTAKLYLSKLKATLNLAIKEKIITINPFKYVDMPQTEEAKRIFLDFEELQALHKCEVKVKPTIKNAFLFSCYSGLRFSDVSKLEWGDIRGNRLEFRQKKSTKDFQYLPLSVTALKILGEQDKKGDKVFSDLPALNYVNIQLKRWAKAAGVNKHLSFHVSRHTFATLALTSGVDLYTVSKLLGHSDIATTQIYAKVIDIKKREAVDKLPEL